MGTEGIQDKYINPYADFGFKLLFGTAMNKELFEAAEIAKFNPKELGEVLGKFEEFPRLVQRDVHPVEKRA